MRIGLDRTERNFISRPSHLNLLALPRSHRFPGSPAVELLVLLHRKAEGHGGSCCSFTLKEQASHRMGQVVAGILQVSHAR